MSAAAPVRPIDTPAAAAPATDRTADPRVSRILDIVAQEAKVDRALLALDVPTDALGITSLDLTLVVFEIEKAFAVEIDSMPEVEPDEEMTVGTLVRHALAVIDAAAPPAAPDASGSAASIAGA